MIPTNGQNGQATSLLDREPEIPYAGEVPLVPNVRPVLVLKGSDFEMGRQHARQIIEIFGPYYLEKAASVKRGKQNLAVIRTSKGYIEEFTPWAIDYVKGMADGCSSAGISMTYTQMLAHFVSNTDARPDDEECSGFSAWGGATKDGSLICGGSGDHEIRVGSPYRYRYEVNVMMFPDHGHNFVYSPPSGGAGHPGMNNKGLCHVHHGTTGYRDRYLRPELAERRRGRPACVSPDARPALRLDRGRGQGHHPVDPHSGWSPGRALGGRGR